MTVLVLNKGLGDKASTRLMASLPMAIVITVALFLLMRLMINTQYEIPLDAVSDHFFDINPVVKELPPLERKVIPERTKETILPPPLPRIKNQNAQQPQETVAPYVLPDLTVSVITTNTTSLILSDRDAQPLVHIVPVYPARAADQGLEGTCEGKFDVSATGQPYNIRVTCTSAVFVRAAMRAIEKWKYNPKIIDDKAVPRHGVVTPFKFQLDQ